MIDKETEIKFLEDEKYRANKDFNKAINIFKAILVQFPKLPPALHNIAICCLLYTSPSPRDVGISRMPSSA